MLSVGRFSWPSSRTALLAGACSFASCAITETIRFCSGSNQARRPTELLLVPCACICLAAVRKLLLTHSVYSLNCSLTTVPRSCSLTTVHSLLFTRYCLLTKLFTHYCASQLFTHYCSLTAVHSLLFTHYTVYTLLCLDAVNSPLVTLLFTHYCASTLFTH